MPLLFALVLGFPIGVAIAWTARHELAKRVGPVFTERSFWIAVAYGAFIHAPETAYFAAFHGDWAYFYWVAHRNVPSAIDLTLVLLCAANVAFGYVASARVSAARKNRSALALFLVPLAFLGMTAVVFERRLAASATYAQFHGGFGVESITQTSLGPAVLFSATLSAAAFVWSLNLASAKAARKR